MKAALGNLRVLDLSRVLAGPWAGQLLGDFGADVVKVERPGCGDDTRQWGPPWLGDQSAYFLAANRNKRSIAIDLANDEGQALVRALAAHADVLIENFKVGTMARFGLDYQTLCRVNGRLVYCSISAYGQEGSRAQQPGYDAMIQGEAGLMSITGPPAAQGGGPQKVGVAIADIMAGMYATSAILAACHARETTGRGQFIDVPLYDSQVAWLANQNLNFLVSGEAPRRMGTAHPNLVPYQAFATADGHLMLAVGNDRQFEACLATLGLSELVGDPRFATNAARVENRRDIVARIVERLATGSTASWLEALAEAGVPAGPINDISEVLGNVYAAERGLVQPIVDAVGQEVPGVKNPIGFEETPVVYAQAPPRLGEHTDEVLHDWLGYSANQVAALREAAAIE